MYKFSKVQFNNIIKLIRVKEPYLTGYGITTEVKYKDDPIPQEEFELCLGWINEQEISSKIDKTFTSYTLKHHVEKWAGKILGHHKYISNGSVVAAIIYNGLDYCSASPDVYTAIKLPMEEKDFYVIPSPYIQYID